MPIPDQVIEGDLGHIQDHNDISAVLTDYESRISAIEVESSEYLNISSSTQEKTGDLNLSGNVTINNLTVTGTQTINNTQSFEVEDPIAYFAVGQWSENVLDIGFVGSYGTTGGDSENHYHTGLIRDASDSGKWKLVSNLPHETGSQVSFSSANYDTLKIGSLEVISTSLVNNFNADKLDGEDGSYYLNWSNITNKPSPTITLSGDVSGSASLSELNSGTIEVTILDNSHGHTISNISGLQSLLDLKASQSELTSHSQATTNIHGIADTSLLATRSYVDTAESDAITSANSYSDSLAVNYDPAGSAASAQSAAESYADSLAVNYDPAGSAASAENNANSYTDSQIISVVGKIEHVSRSTWTGTAIQSSVQAASVGILTVTFPVGKFSQVPKVFTQNIDDGSSARMAYAKFTPYSISTSSVSMQVINHAPPSTVTGGGSITKAIVDIMAVQESI
jgi:hypothetical protein